jgi:hypothetical protein
LPVFSLAVLNVQVLLPQRRLHNVSRTSAHLRIHISGVICYLWSFRVLKHLSISPIKTHPLRTEKYFITWLSVTIEGVWIDNWIYWTLADPWLQINKTLSLIHTLYSLLDHILQSSQSAVFTSRYLVTASNGGRSPSSGFSNCPRVLATRFSQQQLTRTEPQQTSNLPTHSPTNYSSLH